MITGPSWSEVGIGLVPVACACSMPAGAHIWVCAGEAGMCYASFLHRYTAVSYSLTHGNMGLALAQTQRQSRMCLTQRHLQCGWVATQAQAPHNQHTTPVMQHSRQARTAQMQLRAIKLTRMFAERHIVCLDLPSHSLSFFSLSLPLSPSLSVPVSVSLCAAVGE